MRATELRVDHLVDPIGLDNRVPRFSWVIESPVRGARQSAYQVIVSSSVDNAAAGHGDLWDSGRVPSNRTTDIPYEGAPLASAQGCAWTVRAWDAAGNESEPVAPVVFEMGLLDTNDWMADWIGPPQPLRSRVEDVPGGVDLGGWDRGRPVLLRRGFELATGIASGRVYVTARGLYELRLNGSKVGEDLLTPGWSDYRYRIPYQVYDVTASLVPGANVLGAVLADGWFSGRVAWLEHIYGSTPSLLAQLLVTFEDGSTVEVGTDSSWEVATGDLLWADLITGEGRDLRARRTGWDRRDDESPGWQPAEVFPVDDAALVAHDGPRVRVLDELEGCSIEEISPGTFLADLGQNMVGWARIQISGSEGDVVQVRHAEVLDDNGGLYVENLRRAQATDVYVLAGDENEILEPAFTFHGFRYVEVSGAAATPTITGVVIGSATPRAGTFECSNPMVNQLQRNIEWGQRGNFLEAPTDCPQRDERLGWMGDAQIFVGTAAWNADVAAFFRKWLQDVVDGQTAEGAFPDVAPVVNGEMFGEAAPGWGDAGVIVPWVLYQRYGDERFLEDAFDAMTAWVDYVSAANPEGLWVARRNNDYGDWLAVNSETPREVLASAYFFHSTDLVARSAEILGRKEQAHHYRELADRIRAAFCDAYVTRAGRVVGDTQTSYVLALAFGLLPEDLRAAGTAQLVAKITQPRGLGSPFVPGTLDTGFLGVGHLLPTLSDNGHLDLAYELLESEKFPSWGYSIAQGATTLWERWDGWTQERGCQTPTMTSFNHYSLGSVGDWLYRVVAGLDPDPESPGFERVRIRPRPGGTLSRARATHNSIRGRFVSEWRIDDERIELDVSVPANTEAEVWIPGTTIEELQESNLPVRDAEGVEVVGAREGAAVVRVGGGAYLFRGPVHAGLS